MIIPLSPGAVRVPVTPLAIYKSASHCLNEKTALLGLRVEFDQDKDKPEPSPRPQTSVEITALTAFVLLSAS